MKFTCESCKIYNKVESKKESASIYETKTSTILSTSNLNNLQRIESDSLAGIPLFKETRKLKKDISNVINESLNTAGKQSMFGGQSFSGDNKKVII